MSELIKHECGIAFVRLLKPLEYYIAKYGTSFYGLNKLYLLMEKQHNRGQDGAGIASIKFDVKPGTDYINRKRSNSSKPIKDIFDNVFSDINKSCETNPKRLKDVNWMKQNVDFIAEAYMGHVRYGTFGKNNIETVHPFIRTNNWMTRNLVVAGNFNLTNVDELFGHLVNLGQHPIETSDTITILEKIGHFLDEENEMLYRSFKNKGVSKKEASMLIAKELDICKILKNAAKHWDGGYVIMGMMGHGDAFIMRDPSGIRPAYYYKDDEVVVAASERSVIQTAFNVGFDTIQEITPGKALIVKKNGKFSLEQFTDDRPRKACSFERIYFSRGTDAEIYKERKALGKALVPAILKSVNYDFENTVFSYIPNTAAVAFRGLAEELQQYCNSIKKEKILSMKDELDPNVLDKIFAVYPRIEKVAVKDVKLRTFITEDKSRDDLVAHVYDITYGTVRRGIDNLVVLDDSIVRGTTLRESIIRILDRLGPKKIVIASSAPQIRYPDCYGIDMAKLSDFIAFKAAIALLREKKMDSVINEVYKKCKEQQNLPSQEMVNHVKQIYKPLNALQISEKISQMLRSSKINAEVEIIYQTIEDLHVSCPKNMGDWYFTGDYPTPGGNKVVNQSFINYIEGKDKRAY